MDLHDSGTMRKQLTSLRDWPETPHDGDIRHMGLGRAVIMCEVTVFGLSRLSPFFVFCFISSFN